MVQRGQARLQYGAADNDAFYINVVPDADDKSVAVSAWLRKHS